MLARYEKRIKKAISHDARFVDYTFVLEEALMFKSIRCYQLEDLAADLGRSGADAWSRLQDSILANASAVWNEATGERKTMVVSEISPMIRIATFARKPIGSSFPYGKHMKYPVAAALNGVKGTVLTLNKRRASGRALSNASLAQARISMATLEALIATMEESLPMWRRYLCAKARLLGLDRLSFFDLFAPLQNQGAVIQSYTWSDFVIHRQTIWHF